MALRRDIRKSGMKCVVNTCNSTNRLNIRHFKLNKSHVFYQTWLQNCNIKNSESHKIIRVCEKHFETKYFTKKGLKKNAVPTLNLPDRYDTVSPEELQLQPLVDNISEDNLSMVTILSIDYNSEMDENYNNDSDMLCTDFSKNTKKTYSLPTEIKENSENDILTFEEPYYYPSSNLEIESPNCKNCLKNIKNESYYRLKYYESLKILQLRIKEIKNLKRIRNSYKQKIKRFQHRSPAVRTRKPKYVNKQINTIIDQLGIHKNPKIFCKMLMNTRTKNKKWPNEQKLLAQNIYYRSSGGYKYLRENLNFNLPSKTSLVRWQPIKHLSPGFNEIIFSGIKEKICDMSYDSKQVVLIFDEVYIKSELVYNIYSDQIDGFVDYGTERVDKMGKIVCCFMIRSIISNWKFVISYFVSSEPIKSEKLFLLINQNLDKCKDLGVKIRAIICDQGSSNRKCYKMLGMSIHRPFFEYDDQKIIGIYDPPHLIKSVRNTLLTSDLQCPDGRVSWSIIKELYELEQNSVTKCCPRITKKHIYPNQFEKMRVKLAVQVLSRSVAAGIKTAIELKKISNDNISVATATYNFIEKMDKLFDCLNSKSKYSKNKFGNAFTVNSEIAAFLDYMADYVSKIKIVKKVTVYCFNGLIQTINGIREVALQIQSENIGIDYLLTSRFNQDPIENLFAQIRGANGHNKNPSVFEFNHNIAKITAIKILSQFSKVSNCEEDLDESLKPLSDMAEIIQQEINCVPIGICEVPATDEFEFVMEDVSDISDNFLSLDVLSLTDVSMRYFVGYVAYKMVKKLNCLQCEQNFLKKNDIMEAPSEYLIYHKNYYNDESDFGRLNAPTDRFFDICKDQIIMFGKIFSEKAHIKNLKEYITNICVHNSSIKFPDIYSDQNPCSEHNKLALNFLILVLIRKHCTWLTEKYIDGKYQKAKSPNWRIVLQGK